MPKQEVFFEQQRDDRRVEVLKSYDEVYAREAFDCMDEEARKHLWSALKPEENYESDGLPKLGDSADINDEAGAFLWDELVDQALEDPRAYPRQTSFFIVNKTKGGKAECLYVSPDWPSAESFALTRLAGPSINHEGARS